MQHQKRRMGELHGAPEITDLARQHHLGAFHQCRLEVLDVEEGRRHRRLPVAQSDDEVFTPRLPVRPLQFRFGDDVDERDVDAFLQFLALACDRHLVAVLARVVAQQIVDRADPEVFLERVGRFAADHEVETVGQFGHGYSTPPISSASPRWPV